MITQTSSSLLIVVLEVAAMAYGLITLLDYLVPILSTEQLLIMRNLNLPLIIKNMAKTLLQETIQALQSIKLIIPTVLLTPLVGVTTNGIQMKIVH